MSSTTTVCMIPGCTYGGANIARGWCPKHYQQCVRALLLCIRQHLLLKQEQADLVLSLPARHRKDPAFREHVKVRLTVLNKRGIA